MRELNQPNLLLITYDQWRGDWGDPYQEIVPLPTLTSLAKGGWTARRCYTSCPHCVPARFSWLTGLEPSQIGVTKNKSIDLPADAPSIVRSLQEEGYYTALVGKTHWTRHDQAYDLRENRPLMNALGFNEVLEIAGPRALRRIKCDLTDDWEKRGVLELQRQDLEKRYGLGRNRAAWAVRPTILPQDLYPDCWLTSQAQGFIKSMPKNQPWLLWISYVGPHEPFDTPAPWAGRSHSLRIPSANAKPEWISKLRGTSELKILSENWSNKLTANEIDKCRRDYADHLQLLDEQLKIIIETLKQRSDFEQTAIAITSDHGELLGDAEMLYKGCFLEGAIRVPWIYRQPPMALKHEQTMFSSNPLSLTALLKQTFINLRAGGNASKLKNWADRQSGAVVEFGKELLLIQGKRKLAVDAEGNALWAIHLGRDPSEQINIIMERQNNWMLNPMWIKLKRWSKKISRIRSQSTWVWRELRSNT